MSRNTQSGKVYRYPKITVNMVDRDVIEHVARLFETNVYDIPASSIPAGRQLQYRATITGSRAAQLMATLRPWLSVRRAERIDTVLAEYGELESTEVRRRRSCSEAAKKRWAMYGERSGKLPR